MDSEKIELRKLRNFSENLNDTFQFIKQEFKPLLGSFMAICGFFIILLCIIGGIYQQDNVFLFKAIFSGSVSNNQNLMLNRSNLFNWMYFFILFFGLFVFVLTNVVLAAYFKIYLLKNKVSPTIEEVSKTAFKYVIPIFFMTIVYGIITFISMMFCAIPFFYFSVVFAPFTLIYVIEDVSFGIGFNRCFTLIKDNYWVSLAIYIITFLIFYLGTFIISFSVGKIFGIISYFTTSDIGASATALIISLRIFSSVFYIIFFVSIALNYFNLTEQIDGGGLLKRIDNLGGKEDNLIEEQY